VSIAPRFLHRCEASLHGLNGQNQSFEWNEYMALILSVADKELNLSYISKPQANWTIEKLPCCTLVKLRSASLAKLAKGGAGVAS